MVGRNLFELCNDDLSFAIQEVWAIGCARVVHECALELSLRGEISRARSERFVGDASILALPFNRVGRINRMCIGAKCEAYVRLHQRNIKCAADPRKQRRIGDLFRWLQAFPCGCHLITNAKLHR